MKLTSLMIVVLFSVVSFADISEEYSNEDAAWGVKELELAVEGSNVAFKEKFGATLYGNINGFSVERTVQGNTAKTKVTYKDANGNAATASFFCHAHGSEIDCH